MEPTSCSKIAQILRNAKREDLSNLLSDSMYDFTESSTFGSRYYSTLTTVNIYSSIKINAKLKKLAEQDINLIIDAFRIIYPVKAESIEINSVEFFVNPDNPFSDSEEIEPRRKFVETTFWGNNQFRMFISHSSKIKEFAHLLSEELKVYAITSFVAHDDIEPTKEWQSVIEDALFTCDGVLVLLNDEFHKSKWTDQEVGISYGLKKIIIPLRMGIDPYGFLGKFQGLQAKGKKIKAIAFDVFKLLNQKEESSELISKSIINKFVNSTSFIKSLETIPILEELTHIDRESLGELKNAGESNLQIKGAFGVPARLDNLLKRWENS